MTIDYKALAKRLEMHAECHANVEPFDDEQRQWADDLRTVVSLLNGMAEQEPIAHMMPSDLERFAESETFAQAYSVAVSNPEERSVPLFTHPAPQPQPQHKCWCRTCLTPVELMSTFVVCPQCGDKRCPRADDHRNTCVQPQPERQPVSEAHREAVLGAVARGWCHPENANKEMDATLAIAIADEVLAINRSEPTEAQPMSEDYIRGYDAGFIVGAEKGRSEPTEAQIEARDALLDFISENGTASEGVQHYLDRYVRAALAAKEK